MALLHSSPLHTNEPCLFQPFCPFRIYRFPLDTQLQLTKKGNSKGLPYGPSVCCISSSSASTAFEGFQRLWASRVSPSLHVVAALALSFSHASSALAYLLHQKVMLKKPIHCRTGESINGHNNNELLAELDSYSMKRGLSSCFMEQGGLAMALLSTTAMAKDHISPALATLCANRTFMSGLVAWTIAQVLKVFTIFSVERRWDFKMLLGCGGMPSSHSALCVALTTSVAICHGISDALFPVCLGFSLIVMYDATGVRRHAGMQAEVLNLIVEDLFQGHPVSEKKLKELLGHTPLQVGAGAIVGIVAGYLCSQGYTSFPGHGL